MKARAWKAYYPIVSSLKSDDAPVADASWLEVRGIAPEAPLVLEIVRDKLAPIVRRPSVAGFHFLIHDRQSGVPCPFNDHRAYVDLSIWYERPVDLLSRKNPLYDWMWVAPRKGDETLADPHIALLCAQSDLFLRIVERHRGEGLVLAALAGVRQQLHYFANMAQMKIS